MIRALRVTVIVYSIALAVAGLLNIVIPEQMLKTLGFDALSDSARTVMLLVGAAYVAAGVWATVAARDLPKNLIWVKFLITKALLSDAAMLYLGIRGYTEFSDTWWFILIDVVFVALCLAFYPWRSRQTGCAGIEGDLVRVGRWASAVVKEAAQPTPRGSPRVAP